MLKKGGGWLFGRLFKPGGCGPLLGPWSLQNLGPLLEEGGGKVTRKETNANRNSPKPAAPPLQPFQLRILNDRAE